MIDRVPFQRFDYFGYILSGGVLLTTLFCTFKYVGIEVPKFLIPITQSMYLNIIVVTICCFILGHIIAEVSGWFERLIIGRCISYPSLYLFKETDFNKNIWSNFFWLFCFPARIYYASYPETLIKKLRNSYVEYTLIEPANSSEIFRYCFRVIQEKCPIALSKIEIFRTTYEFLRNISFAMLLTGLIIFSLWLKLLYSSNREPFTSLIWFAIGSFILTYILFIRYLRFLYHYNNEIFRSFHQYISLIK